MASIAFIVPYRFIPPGNGGHKAAYHLAAFGESPPELFVVSTEDNPVEGNTPFSLYRLLGKSKWRYLSFGQARKVKQLLSKKKAAACLLHQPFIGLILEPVLRKLNIPLYVWVQNIEYERFRSMKKWYWPVVFWVERHVYRKAEALFFIAPHEIAPAIKAFKLDGRRCFELPYICQRTSSPSSEEVAAARKKILERHGFSPEEKLLLFFGPQTYLPNREAVEKLLNKINPLLKKQLNLPYRILICGGGLPEAFRQMPSFSDKHIAYLGYVEKIEEYVLAADLVLNPIVSGGGVKIKVLEALAAGKTVISFRQGALGIRKELCGSKLQVVEDNNYKAFCEKLAEQLPQAAQPTPPAFYEHHSGRRIRALLNEIVCSKK